MQLVYHGSREYFGDSIVPRRHRRKNKAGDVIFDEISFHASPHRWIGLAYMYDDSKKVSHPLGLADRVGVDLYENKKIVEISGGNSLGEALIELYGEGGYLYIFHAKDFLWKEGLGNLEVVCNRELKPIAIERIEDPVAELKKEGVAFEWTLGDSNSSPPHCK